MKVIKQLLFFAIFLPQCISGKITLEWKENILTLTDPKIPGGKIETWYLEAYCKPGSTDRKWDETLISHTTKLLSASPTEITLRCSLADGVTVDHLIVAGEDAVTFTLTAKNPTDEVSEAHWGQPCIRVGTFTGTESDDDKYSYLSHSFIFLDGQQSFLPTKKWATKARYTPGQVWCPCHVNRDDVNPRPLSSDVPSNGLIGCVSADKKYLFATAWEPYQELFQGVIRCIHSDFRIGGLKPGETKVIRGKFYLLQNDSKELLRRYREDFPLQALDHQVLTLPVVTEDSPAPGRRVSLKHPVYQDSAVHHSLYLPQHWNSNWQKTKTRYPLIVEYSGNKFPAAKSTGRVEDSVLGYGLTSGRAIWLNLPFVSPVGKKNQLTWWGDEKATVEYAKKVVPQIIADFGADPGQVILCGFSRGAIGVNYIGLYDDEISKLWSAFVTHDHYDGEREWPGTIWGSPLEYYRDGASKRLARINGRPVLICQNPNPNSIRAYLKERLPLTNFTFLNVDTSKLPVPHAHTDRWLLHPGPARHKAWRWIDQVIPRN